MPKKSKVNKLARMSDEERAKYLQHKADLEEEARRRKSELIARFIKNKLDKEEAFSRINTAKLNQEWRFILRKIKCKQMALDIQGMIGSFNFMLERKNKLLSSLMKAVDDSDEQQRRAFQAHAETLSYFLSIGAQRLDKLQNEYDRQKNILLENWDKEELNVSDSQDRAEFKLRLIVYIQERDFNDFMNEKRLEWATVKNDKRLEHEEEMRGICRPKQLEIETYCSKLREVYNTFLEHHNPIMGHYQTLREKDEFYQRDIARNELQIQQASEFLSMLQKQCLKTTGTMESKLKRMNSHKEQLTKRYWLMKRDSKIERSKANVKLAVMVDASQNAIKRLEKVKDKLNKIMQLSQICGKYELEDDKMVDKDNDEETLDFEHLDGAMVNECQEYSKMEKFMLKVNRVKVQNLCLKAEKVKLEKENVQLKHYIKKYLTDLALKGGRERPASVKLPNNGLKTTNGKINRPVTCIEGALSNAVLHEKRMKIEKRNKAMEALQSYPRVQCWIQE